jgi:DNA-binding transcriptional MerR regulator
MAKVSLSKASKDTGVSLPTLSRWRASGKISAQKKPNGSYEIDTSEYDRIEDLKKSSSNMKGNKKAFVKDSATPDESIKEGFELQLELLHNQLNDKDTIIKDLREDRDDWKKQAQTLLLQDQRTIPLATPDEKAKSTPEPFKKWLEWFLYGICIILLTILAQKLWQIRG